MKDDNPYRPSNSTKGEVFYGRWCSHCTREARGNCCEILTRSMAFDVSDEEYPEEWIIRDGTPQCTAFDDDRGQREIYRSKNANQQMMFN